MATLFHKTFSVAAVAVGSYSYVAYRKLASTTSLHISSSSTIPKLLADSNTNRNIVNPNQHVHLDDSREVRLILSNSLSDEQILARFVNGFFGGWIFAPERTVLKTTRMHLPQIEALIDMPIPEHVWSTNQILRDKLPEVGTIYFGAFRVADRLIQDRHILQRKPGGEQDNIMQRDSVDGEWESYIDFVFDIGILRGVHRFSVLRGRREAEGEGQEMLIRFSHTNCDPRENKIWMPDMIETLHLVYAMLLFREGIAQILASE